MVGPAWRALWDTSFCLLQDRRSLQRNRIPGTWWALWHRVWTEPGVQRDL